MPGNTENPAAHSKPPHTTSRPRGCWGIILGALLLLATLATGAMALSVIYIERKATRILDPSENQKFQLWLNEPVDKSDIQNIRPLKAPEITARERRLSSNIHRASLQLRHLRALTPSNQANHATSAVLITKPLIHELASLASTPGWTYNNRLPIGCGSPIIFPDRVEEIVDIYARNQIRLGNQEAATEALVAMTRFLKHDPEYDLVNYFALDFFHLWGEIAEQTTSTEMLRRQLSCIEESSSTLTDIHSNISFLRPEDRYFEELLQQWKYPHRPLVTRRDYLLAIVKDKNRFYRWLQKQPLTNPNLLQNAQNEVGNLHGYAEYVPYHLRRITDGPLRPVFTRLILAGALKYWVYIYITVRHDAADKADLQTKYSDLASSISRRLETANTQ